MATDTGIDEWLESEGIVDRRSRVEAMVVLAEAGLTRAGKQRMADSKLPRAREVLWAKVTPVCADAACIAYLEQAGARVATLPSSGLRRSKVALRSAVTLRPLISIDRSDIGAPGFG